MRKWMPLLAVCLGTFMLLVDITIVTVALPSMAGDLDSSLSDLQWVLDVYALALAALLLGVGSIADQVGRRRVFVVSLVVFALASLGCAVAPDIQLLIAGRVVQGIGAAGMYGTTMALLGMHYWGKDRSIAFSAWGATNAVAAAAGPVLGGLLTELDWRWIFLVNLPVSAVAIPLSLRCLDEYRASVRERTDYFGMAALAVSMATLTYGLIRTSDDDWNSAPVIGLFVTSAVALVLFVLIELRHSHPVLNLALFRRRAFTGLMVTGLLAQLAAFAYLPFTSLWMQSVLGYSAVKAGMYLLPLSAAAFVFAALTGPFDLPPRPLITVGLVLIGAGAALQAVLDAGSTGTSVVLGLVVVGAGAGMLLPALSSSVLSTVPPERGGMAGGAMNALRQLGFALGVAVFGTILIGSIEDSLRDSGRVADPAQGAHALSSGQAQAVIGASPPGERAQVSQLVHSAFATGLNTVLVVTAVIAAVGVVVALFLVRGVHNEELADSAAVYESDKAEALRRPH
ncbi:DHA2 family efflux MFS transporter permease subunit [Streptomyces sp. NPDC055210]